MTTTTDQLLEDIREAYAGGQKIDMHTLAEALVALGWTKTPAFEEHPPLRAYTVGESVYVLKNGDSIPGKVAELSSFGVQVDTDRGPVTIANTRGIKKRQ
jgi:hypothetical protein